MQDENSYRASCRDNVEKGKNRLPLKDPESLGAKIALGEYAVPTLILRRATQQLTKVRSSPGELVRLQVSPFWLRTEG